MSGALADRRFMQAALALGRRGLGNVWPNPAVGCVIVKDGIVVGRGWTQPGGRPHAETEALARAFGPPGEPGSEEEIRLVTASLCAVYAGLVEWGIRVRNLTVDPLWEPAVDALAQMVGLPLHQFQDFSAATTAGLSRAIASVRSAKPKEPIKLDFVLKLTTDPTVMAAFDAAMGAIKAAQ